MCKLQHSLLAMVAYLIFKMLFGQVVVLLSSLLILSYTHHCTEPYCLAPIFKEKICMKSFETENSCCAARYRLKKGSALGRHYLEMATGDIKSCVNGK